jgi:asparagine synthase (glutamine-hydrolysing)
MVAGAIRADAHEIVIDERDFFGALPRLVWHEDEPIAHTSSIPLYFVSRLARDRVKVVLTGEGSDELLGGYGKYPRSLFNWRAGALYSALTPDAVQTWVRQRIVPRLPGRVGKYAQRSFLAMLHTPEATFFDNFAGIKSGRLESLLDAATLGRARAPFAASRASFDRSAPGTPLLNQVLYADIKTYLVELLMKQDQMSMAASIESRVPFLDHKLVEFAAMLPPSAKLRVSRFSVAAQAVKDLLPRNPNAQEMAFWCHRPMDAHPPEFDRERSAVGQPGAAARHLQRRGARTLDRQAPRRRRRRNRRYLGTVEPRAVVPHMC